MTARLDALRDAITAAMNEGIMGPSETLIVLKEAVDQLERIIAAQFRDRSADHKQRLTMQ